MPFLIHHFHNQWMLMKSYINELSHTYLQGPDVVNFSGEQFECISKPHFFAYPLISHLSHLNIITVTQRKSHRCPRSQTTSKLLSVHEKWPLEESSSTLKYYWVQDSPNTEICLNKNSLLAPNATSFSNDCGWRLPHSFLSLPLEVEVKTSFLVLQSDR